MPCTCPPDALACPNYPGVEMIPLRKEICAGGPWVISPPRTEERCEQFRTRWRGNKPDPKASGPCRFFGLPLVQEGSPVFRDCPTCPKNAEGRSKVRLKVMLCQHPARSGEQITALDCGSCDYRPGQPKADAEPIILVNDLMAGDVLVMSAAIESLHQQYPNRYLTDVRTPAMAIWDHNPRITKLAERSGVDPPTPQVLGDGVPGGTPRRINMDYGPTINQSNQRPVSFLQAYCDTLERALGIKFSCSVKRPYLYCSDAERDEPSMVERLLGEPTKYAAVNAGYKEDYSCKHWGNYNYQAVVDATKDRIVWVQIGQTNGDHHHKPLRGVIDLIGRTSFRELIMLAYHSQFGLGPSTFLQHIYAGWNKPYVLLAGGREPASWMAYPKQIMLSTEGQLTCCREGACWASRTVPIGNAPGQSLCRWPVLEPEPVPKCLEMIRPADVVRAIERLYEGGVLNLR